MKILTDKNTIIWCTFPVEIDELILVKTKKGYEVSKVLEIKETKYIPENFALINLSSRDFKELEDFTKDIVDKLLIKEVEKL